MLANILGRGLDDGLLAAARERGFGIIAFSPLANGLLSSKYLDGIPPDSRAATDFWSGENVRNRLQSGELVKKLRALHAMAQRRSQSLAQMSLAWVLRLPEITSALIGASKVQQIEENVAALANLHFADEELREIDAIVGG